MWVDNHASMEKQLKAFTSEDTLIRQDAWHLMRRYGKSLLPGHHLTCE
jgi:hypothetical protein